MDAAQIPGTGATHGYAALPFPVRRAGGHSALRLVVDEDGEVRDEGYHPVSGSVQSARVSAEGAAVARLRREAGPPEAVRAVVRENRLAARLDADDARLMFAQRVSEVLDGGEAAILTPENRRRALRMARLLGMRPFDASLVVAIVQDNARRGVPATMLSRDARLVMVAPSGAGREAAQRVFVRAWVACALAGAGAVFGALVMWVTR